MVVPQYIKLPRAAFEPLRGDLAAMMWYAALLDYCQRFQPDEYGFVRISHRVIESDYGFNQQKIKRFNMKLRDAGLLITDTVARGRRTPTGYRLKQL